VLLWGAIGVLWNYAALGLLLSGALEPTPASLRMLLFWHLGFIDPLRPSGEWASPGLGVVYFVVGALTAAFAGACFGALVGLIERGRGPRS
jgi:hypothetical protein